MILEHLPSLAQKHIVLASASPRRAELLRQVGIKNFEIVPSSFAEGLAKDGFGGAAGYAKETARCKAIDVASLDWPDGRPDLIIGADTVVEIDGLVLEKPSDATAATEMLKRMSGRQHKVHTGMALIVPSRTDEEHLVETSASTTLVDFDELTPAAIDAYIKTGEPFDKAGAYGIQGPAGLFIKGVQGCHFNVMGFPLHDFAAALKGLIDRRRLIL